MKAQHPCFPVRVTHPAMTKSSRPLLHRCLAVIAGLVLGVLVAETALRLLDRKPERYARPNWQVFDGNRFRRSSMWGSEQVPIKRNSRFLDVDMGEYVPGARFRVNYASNPHGDLDPHNGVEMRINSLGLRGPEIDPDGKRGTLRLLGLGDSFTFGVGVAESNTFLRQLESQWNCSDDRRGPLEVLNAGTQGYNTRDEVRYLEHRWLVLKPDAVLITFYLNDAYRDEAAVAFWNNGEGLGVFERPTGLAKFSRLADWVQHQWRVRQLERRMQEHYAQAYFRRPDEFFESDPAAVRFDWYDCRAAFEHAAALAHTHGFTLGVAIFPELIDLGDDYPFEAIHRFVAGECREIGLPVLDLLPAFRGRHDRKLWVHPTDHHPNRRAHRIAAEAMLPFVRERLLVAGEPSE